MPFVSPADGVSTYRPERFGAVGGGADDTAALVAMAAAVNASSGAAVVVIDGTHRTTKTLQFTKAGLQISGGGKLIKGGPISTTAYSDTDTYEAASLITLAGAGQRLVGMSFDNDGIDGEASGYGRAVAICANDVSVEGVKVAGFINGIESGWNSTGFLNWSGVELHRARVANCHVTGCRPHHDAANTSVGGPVRLYSSNSVVIGNHVQAADSYTNLELLHGIKLEGLLDRHTGDSAVNDPGGVIIGNTVTGPFQHSIYSEGMDGVVIAGNTIRKTGREGITFQGADTMVIGNTIEVGGYQDANPACGIRSLNGKNYRIEQNIITPWRNVSGSATGHIGILLGTSNGHGTIANNTISRAASVRTKYRISGASGSLTTGSGASAAITGNGDVFRVVDDLTGDILTLGQGTGWFEVGATITQAATGWSATVAEWIEPTDTRLERGIDCSSFSTTIDGNTIDGVAQTGIYLRYGTNLRVRRNTIRGYSLNGVMVQDYVGDLAVDHNEIGEALAATGSGIYLFTFGAGAVISVKGNRLVRNATALRWGNSTIDGMALVVDNILYANTTAVTNNRSPTVTYRNNDGYAP